MLGVDVLRSEDLQRVPAEDEPSGFPQIPASDDSVSNSDDTNKSFNSELNINDGIDNLSQTEFVAKMKNNKFSSHEQKPYSELSDREKQRLMERQDRRKIRLHEEMRRFFITRSISQLGKDDLVKSNDNGVIGHRRRENSTCSAASLESSGDDLSPSSSFEEDEDMERNLEYFYESCCDEGDFQKDKSRQDLVKNYMDLESELERNEKASTELRHGFDIEAELEKIRVFKEEIEILTKENDVLQIENEKLRLRLSSKAV